MKHVLVTGAAGFIASTLAKELQKMGYIVVTVDNLTTGFRSNIPEGVIFVEGNCQDEKIINSLANYNFEAIFHIAGQSSGEISFDNPIYDLESNASSTLLLLKLALKIGCKKVLYASTMSIYGYLGEHAVHEDEEKTPKSFYGVGKLASEHYLRLYAQYGIDSFAMRLFTVYGPGQNMDNLRQGMVSIFLAQAFTNGDIQIKGDLNRYRDFIYIDDVVSAFISAFKSNLTGYNYFNVSTGQKTTVGELISLMVSFFPNKITQKIEGKTEGDILGIHGDNNKIKKHLNWEPKYTLSVGLKKMYDWLVSR
ncbi:MAG: NAD-dependent epimerase/dehydratase family protein [Bacteroidota bacterium]